MKSTYKANLNLLINQYRAAVTRAKRAMAEYQRNPDRELLVVQCEHYKEAADLCGQIATYYPDKQDRDEWLAYQEAAEREMQRIYDIATNRVPTTPPDYFDGFYREPDPVPAGPTTTIRAGAPAKAAPKSGTKTSSPDGISDEVVKSWFPEEGPKHGFDKVSGMLPLVRKLRHYVFNVAASRFKEHMDVGSTHSFFLYGPPGCGKTFIIEAFIHELMKQGYSYMTLSGADIHASLVGEAEKRVERAFLEARRHAPCILFIDEIDSVCRVYPYLFFPMITGRRPRRSLAAISFPSFLSISMHTEPSITSCANFIPSAKLSF